MARSSMKQIENDEMKIIHELQKNARESIDKIAERCDFSRQKVWRIMNKLEENHKIWGYSAVIDDEKIGINRYFILIKRTITPLTSKLAEKIVKREIENIIEKDSINIECSHFVHGKYDWIICLTAKNIKQAKKFCDILQNVYHGNISNIIILENLFSIRNHGLLNPNKEEIKDFL
jgi:DNA-binding Lrp family transcriptional regulator